MEDPDDKIGGPRMLVSACVVMVLAAVIAGVIFVGVWLYVAGILWFIPVK